MSPTELPQAFRYYFDREFTREELVSRISDELNENVAYLDFVKAFNSNTEGDFRKSYAEKKAAVLLDSKYYREQIEYHDSIFRTYAENRFWDIQQKKLFDLQCLWRAEKARIPEIESVWDFDYWQRNIENCRFIPEVTRDEVDMYIEYLNSCDVYLVNEEWQNYDEFKLNEKDDDDGLEHPEWYDFHNLRTGNAVLLSLQDVRGEKEDYYRGVWRTETYGPEKREVLKPLLFVHDDEIMNDFLGKVESAQFKKMYERFCDMKCTINSQEEVEDAFYFLTDLYHEVPIESHADWRQGLIHARNKYINRKIAEEIPVVFEEYQLKLSLGISYPVENDTENKSFYESLKKPVLEGRRLKGEPEDFNF